MMDGDGLVDDSDPWQNFAKFYSKLDIYSPVGSTEIGADCMMFNR